MVLPGPSRRCWQSQTRPRAALNRGRPAARRLGLESPGPNCNLALAPACPCRLQLESEKRRSSQLAEEVKRTKEQSLAVQKQVEQEEEYITNKLLQRLAELKKVRRLAAALARAASLRVASPRSGRRRGPRVAPGRGLARVVSRPTQCWLPRGPLALSAPQEKQTLANEVEAEEDYLVNTLQRRLTQLNKEKSEIESKLEMEQGACTGAGAVVWRAARTACILLQASHVLYTPLQSAASSPHPTVPLLSAVLALLCRVHHQHAAAQDA